MRKAKVGITERLLSRSTSMRRPLLRRQIGRAETRLDAQSRWGHHRETSYAEIGQQWVDLKDAATAIAAPSVLHDRLHLDLVRQERAKYLASLRRPGFKLLFKLRKPL